MAHTIRGTVWARTDEHDKVIKDFDSALGLKLEGKVTIH